MRAAARRSQASVAVLDRADVDTDQIIPKQFLKRIERSGYGEFLFYDWMKDDDVRVASHARCVDPRSRAATSAAARRASTRRGRSRITGSASCIAPSFGDIFRQNAINSGLAPVVLEEDALARVKDAVAARNELTVDVAALEITHPDGLRLTFELDPNVQERLVEGLDDVAENAPARRRDRGVRGEVRGALRPNPYSVALPRSR